MPETGPHISLNMTIRFKGSRFVGNFLKAKAILFFVPFYILYLRNSI
jgi:hypothetical protein